MTRILILKTGALGDVLRTTSILPGLHERYPSARVTWLTATGAVDLVRTHPLVEDVVAVDAADERSLGEARERLGAVRWDRLLSFDDEEALCALASALPAVELSGAYLERGERRYTPDVAPWFEMGLLSVHGKAEADRRKLANERTHPEIFASMLGLSEGRTALELPTESRERARAFAARHRLGAPAIGLNTGAGGRWSSKELSVDRTLELARLLDRALDSRATFVVFGGPEEAARNRVLVAGLARAGVRHVDAGTENPLLDFAALVSLCDLLVTSDSLALHVAIARRVPVVAFFAPTSAAEIELHGMGEKVCSTAPDYCSYRPDADNSSITPERLLAACLRALRAEDRAR